MLIGIDSFADRLDLTDFSQFQLWNGGIQSMDPAHPGVIGGDPAFAGRNFLGGDFIWAHAEATNALKAKKPWDLLALSINAPRIAPIQAPNRKRQSQGGTRGFFFGQIDGRTICKRIASGARAGEFLPIGAGPISVWLGVDPNAAFTADYWAGWASEVNSFVYKPSDLAPDERPFAACILCRYVFDPSVGLIRDPHVTATLASTPFRTSLDTDCYDFWADAPDPDDEVPPRSDRDFTLFFEPQTPAIWRFSNSFPAVAGTSVKYSLDIVREPAPELTQPATAHMLKPAKWQPSATNVVNMGVLNAGPLSDATITCITARTNGAPTNPIPAMPDVADEGYTAKQLAQDGHVFLPRKEAKVVGRYLRHPDDAKLIPPVMSVDGDEIQRLSNAGLSTFVVWERYSLGPTNMAYFIKDRGTQDGKEAFQQCGDVLRIPPHTIIYFAVDFDAGVDLRNQTSIIQYFKEVAAQRDIYLTTNPDRPYEIGAYAPGEVLDWVYKSNDCGFVSGFWPVVSSGYKGNTYGIRPWGHSSRWQYQYTGAGHPLPATWSCPIAGSVDPDVDWGDGGQWNQNDPLAVSLAKLEAEETAPRLMKLLLEKYLPALVP